MSMCVSLFRSDGRKDCEPTRCLRRVTASSSAASTVCNRENAMIPLERTARAGADLRGGGPEGPQRNRPQQSCKAALRLRVQTPLRRNPPGPGRPGTRPGSGRSCSLPSRPPLSTSPPHGLAAAARLCSEPASPSKRLLCVFIATYLLQSCSRGGGQDSRRKKKKVKKHAGKVRDERRGSARPLPRGRNSSGKVRATRKVREGEGAGTLCPVMCVRACTPAERLL
jgi:hypothetical protein